MTIASAIRNRQLLSFSYDGHTRVVEPHTYGVDGKGHYAVRAYQVRGGSESGEFVGWKLFHVSEIHHLVLLAERFSGSRPKYSRGDRAFSAISAEI